MNVGDKILRYSGPVWWAFCAVASMLMFNHAFSALTEHDQRLVSITLFAAISFSTFVFWGRSMDRARESIEQAEAKEDGLTTEYPSYGYLRSAHREIHE